MPHRFSSGEAPLPAHRREEKTQGGNPAGKKSAGERACCPARFSPGGSTAAHPAAGEKSAGERACRPASYLGESTVAHPAAGEKSAGERACCPARFSPGEAPPPTHRRGEKPQGERGQQKSPAGERGFRDGSGSCDHSGRVTPCRSSPERRASCGVPAPGCGHGRG